MRLTLRTLLAYLDDTLEPAEIKQIGQKVAESDAAQELIARIKQTTRRRRLTTPPTHGPGAANFDPNTVAEYLDNALPGEQLAEIEKLCLESDVHLAEIASCHQILTLVLGEPALVPPTARERMYGLVQGKEAIPYRKATAVTPAPAPAHPSASFITGPDAARDDTLLLGLPFYRRQGNWLRWALPAAGLLLVAALAAALWKAMPEPRPTAVAAAPPPPSTSPGRPAPEAVKADEPNGGKGKAGAVNPEIPSTRDSRDKTPQKDPVTDKTPRDQTGKPETVAPTPPAAPGKPAEGRVKVGSYTGSALSAPSILLKHTEKEGASWERLPLGGAVFSSEALVSLPGFASEVKLDSKVSLLLRGHLREYSLVPETNDLLECAVLLHPPPAGVDLDLTLDRGRVYLANRKPQGAAVVRLRFEGEVWDVTLEEPGAEVGVDLFRRYTPATDWQKGEEPLAALYLFAVKGRAGLKENYHEVALHEAPGPAMVSWNNKGKGVQGPYPLKEAAAPFDKQPPATDLAREMSKALEDLSTRMVGNKPVEVVLSEGVQSEVRPQRLLSVYAMGAVDAVRRLFEVLGDEEPAHRQDREAAIFALRHWIARGADYGNFLYDPKTRGGILTENRKFQPGEAATLVELLHDFSADRRRDPETFRVLASKLQSDKHAVRELAYYHLVWMSTPVKLPDYNPGWPAEDRDKAAQEVNKLIDAKRLPPPIGTAAPGNGAEKPVPPPGGAPGKRPR